MTTEEYNELRSVLNENYLSLPNEQWAQRAYCLYGADYFRRTGELDWSPLDESIHHDLTLNENTSGRYKVIREGLLYWQTEKQLADQFIHPFLIEKKGTISTSNGSILTRFVFDSAANAYQYNFGVILKDSGNYRFSIYNFYANSSIKNRDCTEFSYEIPLFFDDGIQEKTQIYNFTVR